MKNCPRGDETILVVDDEVSISKMIQKVLESLGYTVEAFNSSVKALSQFCKQPEKFDLIITDMTMPEMTGDTLSKEIKTIRTDIPIILCTGFSKKISEDEIEDLGINAYCKKPLSVPVMAKKVRRLLDENK